MATREGFFELRTAKQLLAKLETDFERLQAAAPVSQDAQYAAFDFFVTAEHLAEWFATETGQTKSSLRAYRDGALVSDVANGAKHFRLDSKRHKSVQDLHVHSGAFDSQAFDNDAFDVDRLIIERANGTSERVKDIAERVLKHWKKAIP
jgi:hypothetical protein